MPFTKKYVKILINEIISQIIKLNKKNMSEKVLISLSIIIAGLFIAIGIYFDSGEYSNNNIKKNFQNEQVKNLIPNPKIVDPETELIIGNKNAEIFIVEYSDLECPYCKRYNDTASEKLIKKWSDKVGFVFRHFPLKKHPSAFAEAVAVECAFELGGEEKFISYKQAIFSETKSDGAFPETRLDAIAVEIG